MKTLAFSRINQLTRASLMTALIIICTWISINATVSFTMQTFAIFVASAFLGTKFGTLSVLAYIALGCAGLPVFSNFTGGIGVIFGSTGGYIVGFIFIALIVGYVSDKFNGKIFPLFISILIGNLVCYIFGTAWFMFVYTQTSGAVGLMTVLGWCVFPFIIPDLAKMALALAVIKRLHKLKI